MNAGGAGGPGFPAGPGNPGTPGGADASGERRYRRMLAGLMFGGVANFALLYYVQPLLPELAARYNVPPSEAALALSSSTLALALGLVLVGPIADRYGRLPVMRWSLLIAGVVGVASAFAPTWELLLTTRAIEGVALAGLPAVALAYLREEVDDARHVRANAAYITGTAIGGAIGRLVPGPLALAGGWTLASGTMGLLTLAAAAAVWVLVPPSTRFRPRRARVVVAVFGTFAALRDGVVALLCVVGFATMGVFVGVYNAAAFRLEAPPFALGAAVVFVYAAYLVGVPAPAVLALAARRIGRPAATAGGLVLMLIALGLLVVPHLAAIVAGLGILTFAFLGTHSLLSGWIVDRAHRRSSGGTARASSAYLLAYYLGSAIVGVLAVREWQADGWPGVTILAGALAAVALAAAIVAGRLDARRV